jgi:excisionase family DNA binding protein
METKYYTPQEVADMFCVKRITVWDWIRKGKLRATRVGNRLYRISESQLNRFKEKING